MIRGDRNKWVDDPTNDRYNGWIRAGILTALAIIAWSIIGAIYVCLSGCQAVTEVKGGHSEASSTTTKTHLSVRPAPTPPAPTAPNIRIRIGAIPKEPACSSPPASSSSSPSPSAPTPPSTPAPPTPADSPQDPQPPRR